MKDNLANDIPHKIEEDKNLFYKFWWRIKFLASESFGKDLGAIFCSLRSAKNRSGVPLANLLNYNKIIEWDKNFNFFRYKNYKFFYSDTIPISDFVSIFIYHHDYIKKNFINNSAFSFEGPYEKGRVVIKRGDYVIDAGANIGFFAFLASEKVGLEGKVFTFEPASKTHELLENNIKLNGKKNIIIVKNALGDSKGELEFTLSDSSGENSGFFQGSYNKEIVKQITLDSFIKENNIKKIDFIKADIEGMERNLLMGAKETIRKFKPKISICIYHRPSDPEVIESIIKDFVPDYKIFKTDTKLFTWL
jgi:FkbM family methyltransferase